MRRLYRISLYLGSFLCAFLLAATIAFAQCTTSLTVTPATTTICSGSTVSVTIQGSQPDHYYELQNSSTGDALSGFFEGNGGDLTIVSSPLTSSVNIEITVGRPAPSFCTGVLTTVVAVTVDQQPSTADAGDDQLKCSALSFTVVGNDPAVGTGKWTIEGLAYGATIDDPNQATIEVTGLTQGNSVVLRWTITNGVCPASYDEVMLTHGESPPPADAGPDVTQCDDPVFYMNAVQPPSVTGTWYFVSPAGGGGAVITDVNSPTTTVTNVGAGTGPLVLDWELTNGCLPATFDPVTIENLALPDAAVAGDDQFDLCAVTSTTLEGNTPTNGTGKWTVTSGSGGSFVLDTDPVTTFNGTAGTTYVLKWTISNGICAASTDEVTIQFDQAPSPAVAGSPIAQCNNGTFTLNATDPLIGTGKWSLISGTATITDPNSFNSSVTGVPVGTSATLEWTVSNGSCTPNTDQLTLTNHDLPTAALNSDDADNTICAGETVTFTGSGGMNYEFFVNGVSAQANSADVTYTTSTLSDDQIVTVLVTDAQGCSALSSGITMTVNPLPVASLVSSDADNIICSGSAVTFTATPSGESTYDFRVNGTIVYTAATNTFTTSTLSNNDVVSVTITSTAGCVATSSGITMTVNPAIVATISSSDADNTICAGASVTFTASPSGAATYDFRVNGASVVSSASSTYTTSVLTDGSVVDVIVTTAAGCTSTSSGITTTVNPLPVATIVSNDADNIICSGSAVTFTATPSGESTYDFRVNGTIVYTAATNTFTTSTLSNNDVVSVTITSTAGCVATSSGITMTVNPAIAATISSSDADNTICAGDAVTFTASPSGAATYNFRVNGASVVSSASNTYTTSVLTDGSVVDVIVTTAAGCTSTSSGITTTVNPLPVATIVSNDADNIICAGSAVTFTAAPSGASNYDFRVNGASVVSSATNTFTTSTLSNNDVVSVTITSTAGCVATSSGITMTVNPAIVATISSSDADNTICAGASVTFTAAPSGAATYDFRVNGASVVSSASNTYTTSALTDGSVVDVIVTTAAGCTSTSSGITTTVNPLPVATIVSSDADNIICSGSAVTFTATPSGESTYDFRVNGTIVYTAATNTFTTSTLSNNDVVSVTITSTAGCVATSSGLTMTVNPAIVATISSSDGDNTICAGASVTFTASPSGAATYDFRVNGASVVSSASNTYTTSALTDGSVVDVIVTTAAGCTSTSSGITTTVNPLPVATIVSSDADNIICSGSAVTFTATPSGESTYDFRVNGTIVYTAATNTFTTSTLSNNDVVSVTITSTAGCVATSSGITMTVNPAIVATISSSDADNTICAGASVTFTASPSGAATYDFRVNGASVVSSASSTYTTSALTDGSVVDVIVTTAAGCTSTSSGITTTVNPLPVATIVSSDADNIICAGSAVTFTATPSGESTYDFRVNGTIVYTAATNTFTTSTLSNNDVVSVTITSTAGCVATSSGITMTVNPAIVATISSSDADNTICAGASVTFTASPSGAATYDFRVNGASVVSSASSTYTTSALTDGSVVDVIVTTAAGCTSTSSGITTTVNPLPVATIVSNDADNIICSGSAVTFTATPSGESTYDFRVNGTIVYTAATNTFTTSTLSNNDVVSVTITSTAGCVATSSGITMTVNPAIVATISSSDGDNTICAGASVTFTASPSGAATYNFRVNGVSVVSSASNTYTTSVLTDGSVVDVIVTTAAGCTSTSSGITTTVNPLPVATIVSNDADNIICSGTAVTFTATPSGESTYDFRVNGTIVYTAATNTFTTSTLSNNDVVSVTITSTAGCVATSSGITMTVNPAIVATISSSDADNTICAGASVTFTASPSGAATYDFRVNGASVVSSASSTYTTSVLTDGSVVDVIVTTAAGCTSTSSGITTTVNPLPVATIVSNDADNIICSGTAVTFTATPSGESTYDFRVNGTIVYTAATNTFTTSTLSNNDVVSVTITSTAGCVATSSGITMTVNPAIAATISSSDADNTICAGDAVTFTASPSGAATYNFRVNGASVVSSASNTYTTSVLTDGSVVDVIVTTAAGCTSTSSGITTTVNPLPVATIVSNDADNIICAGSSVTFTATPSGASNYDFRVNGASVVSSGLSTFTTSTLSNNDVVSVTITSTAGCVATSSGITMTVNPAIVATISSSDADNTICAGASVTFTAAPSGAATYDFRVNGASVVSSASNTYTTSALTDGSVVDVIVTTAAGCTSTSSGITTTVNPLPVATIVSSDADNIICSGSAVTFTATPSGESTYDFRVNGTIVYTAATSTFTTSTLSNNDVVSVTITSTAGCVATSSGITMTVNPAIVATLSSSDADNTICAGASVTFTASPSGAATYDFRVNGASVVSSASNTYTTSVLTDGSVVDVIVTTAAGCTSTSSGITTTVNPLPVATIVSNDADNIICAGSSVTFTATPSGASNYDFRVNGASVVSSATNTFTTSTLSNNDVVSVTITSTAGCVATSSGLTMTVNPAIVATISSSDADNTICAGASVTFTASPSGAATYDFRVNGASVVSSASDTYTTSALTDGSVVDVIVTTAAGCTSTSSGITTTVNPLPVATIVSNDADNIICAGSSVTFTAAPSGASNYDFRVNGASVLNSATNTFTTSTLSNNDVVSVTITSTAGCVATSSGITMTVNPAIVATISSSDADNTICAGASVTFTASPSGAATYDFRVNGASVVSSASNTYTTSVLTDGSVVDVIVTTAAGCTSTSSGITTTVNPLPVVDLVSNDTDNTICAGSSVTFKASPSGVDTYEFRINGVVVQDSPADLFTTSTLADGDVVDVIVTTTAGCDATTAGIVIRVDPGPSTADAGADQLALCGLSSTTLAGNTPGTGTGEWSVVSGAGGDIDDELDPASVFDGTAGETYILKWTITNACAVSEDEVTIRFDEAPSEADAGPVAIEQCDNSTFTVTAVDPAIGTGTWAKVSGSGAITNPNSFNTTVTGVTAGSSTVLRWTVANGSCPANTDDITLTNRLLPIPSLSSDDADNTICAGETVIFTASGGTSYEFFVNGVSAQANSADDTYTTSTLSDDQIVTVRVTDAQGCTSTSSGITTTVNPLPVATIVSNDADNIICAGSSVTFTATPSGASNYDFRVNGASVVSSGLSTFTTSTLSNNDVVSVTITSTAGCVATSSGITMTVNPAIVATISSSDADNTICAGASVTFTAAPSGAATYDFRVNGASVVSSASNTYTTSVLTDGSVVDVIVTTAAGCTSTSSGITTTVNPLPVATIVSSDADNIICAGSSVTFTATPSGASNYDFRVNGASVVSSGLSTFTTSTLSNNDVVSVTITSTAGCVATSSGLTMTVNPAIVATISSSDADNTICAGASVTFTASPSGAATYDFRVNGASVVSSASNTYTTSVLTDGSVVDVIVTTAAGCTSTSSGITTTVNPLPVASLVSNDADNIICSGSAVTFTATPSGESTYDFRVNGTIVYTAATNTFTTSTLSNNDVVSVTITSTAGCVATSSGITMTVNPAIVATISSSDADNTICAGDAVTFTASPSGAATYNFRVNGASVVSSASNTYTTSVLTDGSVVDVIVTTAAGCTSTSSGITTTVNPLPVATIVSSDADNIICAGSAVTFTATPSGESTYDFRVNGTIVYTAATNTFTTSTLSNNDVVSVTITSTAGCVATSSGITMTVNPAIVATLSSSDADNTICAGASVTFTASPSGAATYDFRVNGASVVSSASNTYTTSALTDGSVVDVIVTTAAGCTSTSSGITTTVNPLPVATIVSNDADNIICAGSSVTFTATPSGASNYDFRVNGASVVSSATNTFTTSTLSNNDVVSVTITSTAGCVATSSGITMTVNPAIVATISSSDADNTICAGASVTFTASPSGAATYDFRVNGASVVSSASNTYTTSALTDGSVVDVIVTTAAGCTSTSSGITTTVNPLPVATIVSSDADNIICAGSAVTFTATPSGESTYDFRVNGTIVYTAATNTFTTSTLSNNDVVSVTITSTAGCVATSSGLTMTVNPAIVATISSSDADNTICAGASVTFTASPSGAATYDFRVNGASVVSSASNTYTTSALTDGSVVDVIVTTAAGCTSTSSGITTTVNPLPVATIVSNDADNIICAGSSVTFTAAPSGASNYDFRVNGASVVSSATNTFTTSTLSNNDVVSVTITSTAGCVATSSGITMTVNPAIVATISSSDADNTICAGASVTFTASPSGAATYDFRVNGASVVSSASNTYTTSVLTDGSVVDVIVTTAAGCTSTSSGITTTVNPLPVATIVSSDADNIICAGSSVTFTATPSGASNYDFRVNGASVVSSATNTFTTSTLSNNDVVSVTITSTAGCVATSSGITMTVNPAIVATISSSDADNTICAGASVTFTAAPSGAATYDFRVNGASVVSSASNTYTTSALTDGSVVDVIVTTAAGCTSTSSGITTTVNPLPVATIVSSDADNIICAGSSVTFTAAPSGASNYDFRVNGASVVSSATNTFTTSTLSNNDVVSVTITSTAGCVATSSGITMTVNPAIAATISSSDADNTICAGDAVTFTASPSGAATYNFRVNGASVVSSASNTYTTSVLTDGSVVDVIVTTAAGCTSTSSGITTTVNPLPVATIVSSDADNIICAGSSVTFTATPSGASNYDFRVNGASVVSSGLSTYTTSTLSNGDQVSVVVTSTSGCVGTSSGITMTVNPAIVATISSSDADNTICAGASVTFTASPSGAATYDFRVNGASVVSSASNTYTTSVLTDGSVVDVIVTTAAGCTSTSSGITTTVNPLPVATIVSNDADNIICAGSSVTFTATPSGASNYDFRVNGASVVSSGLSTFTTSTLSNNDVVSVTITSTAGCVATSSGLTMTVNPAIVATISSSDADNTICAGASVTFTAAPSGAATYDFRVNGASVVSSASNTYTTSVLTDGSVVDVIVTTAAGCTSTSSGITTTVNPLPVASLVSNDADNIICSGSAVTFTATPSGESTYDFRVNGTIVYTAATNTFTTSTLSNNDVVSVTITSTAGCVATSSGITMTVNPAIVATISSSDADNTICAGDAVTFTASPSGAATYNFRVNGASVVSSASNTYTTSVLTDGSVVDVIVTTAAGCTSTSSGITTTVNPLPVATIVSNDADNIICAGSSVTFTATPSGASNYDFRVNGASVVSSATNTFTTSTLSNNDVVSVTITSTAGCVATSSGITMTVNPAIAATISSSDADNTICGGDAVTFTASPSGAATYNFRVNGASVVSSASNTYTTSALTDGSVVDVIVTTAAGCTSTSSGITTTVNPLPVASLVSSDADNAICEGSAVTFTATPAGESIYDFRVNGTIVYTAATNTFTTSTLSNNDVVSITITSTAGCIGNSAGITMDVYDPVIADAGLDQELCDAPEFTLGGVAPSPATATGIWSFDGPDNGAVIDDPSSANSLVTGLPAGYSVTLLWSVTNGACSSSDEVILTNRETPPVADAGDSQTLCNTSTFTMAANAATPGSGLWTIDAGAATITNTASPTTTVTDVPVGTSVTLRWTISNGPCSTSDVVVLTNSGAPTTALAGDDLELCSSGNFTLAGNDPVTGAGEWSIIGSANGAVITTPASYNSTVTGLTIGSSVTLSWTITNGACVSSDEVVLTNSDTPTTALAGPDQEQCNNSTFTLAANSAGVGSGEWTIEGAANGAVITNISSPTTTVTDLIAGNSVTLRWTISNGSCISFQDVILTNKVSATVSDAGDDQQICGPSTTLDANVPGVGAGNWTVVSGAGGTVNSPSDPFSTFDGTAGNTYVLRWTVTNGICSSSDDLQIVLKRVPDVDASSTTICSGSTANIAITNPNGVPGTSFSWVVQNVSNVSGASAGNSNVINQNLTVTDGITQGTITYRITPEANGCPGAPLDITVTVNPTPVITTAAADLMEQICSEEQLNFTPSSTVAGTTYSWISSVSGALTGVTAMGTGAIQDTPVSLSNTSATITYTITPSIAGCSGDPVNYVVTVRPRPDVTASDQTICSGQSTAIALTNPNNVAGTTFTWVVASSTNVSGAANGSGNSIGQVLTSTDAVNTGTVRYTITPSANGCEGDPFDVNVMVTPVPVITNSASDFSIQLCSSETLNFTPTSTIGGTTYSWTTIISGPVDAASITAAGTGAIDDTPINTGNVAGTVTYRMTPQFSGCNGTPVDVVVTVKPLPSASGSDLTICSGQTASITIDPLPKNVAGTTFTWTALPSANITGATNGNGSNINQLLTTTNASVGTVVYTITPFANGCQGPQEDIYAYVNPIATVDAGTDFDVCEPLSIPVSGTIAGSASSGTWTVTQGAGVISSSVTAGSNVTATYSVDPGDVGNQIVLTLTTDDPDAAGPCSIVSDNIKITINQRARVTVPSDFVICESSSIPLTGDLDPSATAGSWGVLSGAGTLSVSSITGEIVTANYTPHASDIGNTVSFRLTTNDPDGFGPCVPAYDDINITINESAKVDAGSPIVVCQDQVVKLNGSTGGQTSFVTWTGGSGAAQFTDPGDPLSDYNLTTADVNAGTIYLTLTTDDPDGAGPCSVSSDQVSIGINKLPEVFLFGLGPQYAENDDEVSLTGIPTPGIFTGPGVLAGTNEFYPSNAGAGSKTITYTHTDASGCTNSASASTIVNPVTEVDFNIEEPSDVDALGRLVICANSGNNGFLRLIGTPEWNDPSAKAAKFISPDSVLHAHIAQDFVNGYRINTRGLQGGSYLIQYIFTNQADATDTLTKELIVNSAPKAIIDVPNSCIQDMVTFRDNSAIDPNDSGGNIIKWSWTYGEGGSGNDGVSQNPTYKYAVEGFKTLTLRVETNQGCLHDTTHIIRVSNPPNPDFTWSKICVETETTEFKDLSDPGIGNIIQYAWNFNDGDTLGYGVPSKAVPANTHGGKTSNTYRDPHHSYDDFQVYNVSLSIKTDDGCENAITKRIFILDYDKPTPTNGYHENFENGKGTWVETSSHTDLNKTGEYSWVFGTPAGEEINSAYSGVNAWWTGGNPDALTDFSTYYQNDSTEVTGPCLDLTGIERPMISLNYWAHSQENFDGAVVQYSTNGGATWRTIGDAEKRGINWYNSKNLPNEIGSENRFAWTGKTYGWKNARFNLDEIPVAERDLVVFRIAFGSNSDNLPDSVLSGFAFDDIYIGEKKRTVLVEQFVNSNDNGSNNARAYLDNLFTNQTLSSGKTESDFIKIQYHIADPGYDQFNDDNPTDPATRAFIYGLDTPPSTVMDGILGASPYNQSNSAVAAFNGDHALVNKIEIDRRALDDPKFMIDVSMDMAQAPTASLTASVTFTYIDSLEDFSTPVIFHAALVEDDLSGNNNVLRKLLWGSGGRTEVGTWTEGTSLTIPIDYTIDVPITDPDNLYLIVFAQDKRKDLAESSDFMLQSAIVKVPAKIGLTPVGIADNPFDAEIRDIDVYPNPASKQINFALANPLSRNYTYRIIDQRGVTILEGDLNQDLSIPQAVELNVLSNGIYFVQFRTADKVVVYKKIAVMNRH